MDKLEIGQITQQYFLAKAMYDRYCRPKPRKVATRINPIDLLGLIEEELADGFTEISPIGLAERSDFMFSSPSIGRAIRRTFPTAERRRTAHGTFYIITTKMLAEAS